MPKFIIPVHELKQYVDPRDGAMWKCERIDMSEIHAALASDITENRQWDDLVNTLGYEESRVFHINRIATLAKKPPPPDAIILVLENHTTPVHVYLNDGNHRLAAAYVRGDTHITAIVAASVPESVREIFPGAIPT